MAARARGAEEDGMAERRAYRADHVGSLLRPAEVLRARAARAAGGLADDGLRAAEDQAILAALALQKQAGVDVYTDGELRRASFLSDLSDAVEGFVPNHIDIEWHGPNAGPEGSVALVVGAPLRQHRRLTGHEIPFLQAHAPGPIKATLPSPTMFTDVSFKPGLTDRFYPSRSALLDTITSIMAGEIQALADEGVPYVQVDAPRYTFYVDPRLRERLRATGVDPDRGLDEALAADNACLLGVRREQMTLGIHLCRGNNRSRWMSEGGYDPIAEKLFGTLAFDRFLLEYDDERSGGFEPLRFVPPDKTVVLGLVSTKRPELESVDELRRRIDAAARYVPLERLALSPQCGFASVAAGNLVTEDDQRRKLERVAETARRVWG